MTPASVIAVHNYENRITCNGDDMFEMKDSNVSCGVGEIDDLQDNFNDFTESDYKRAIVEAKSDQGVVHLIASINHHAPTALKRILDNLAIAKTGWKLNSNSNNRIKTYIL